MEPQSVAQDRPADARIVVVAPLQRIRCAQPGGPQLLREVVALHGAVPEAEHERACDAITTVLRDVVDPHAAGGQLGRYGTGVDRDLLIRAEVRRDDERVGAVGRYAERDTILGEALIGAAARALSAARHLVLRAADVLADRAGNRHARNQRCQVLVAAAGRNRIDDLVTEHALLCRVLHVHDGRLTAHHHGFRNLPDTHVDADRRGERPLQLDAVAPDRRETAQREGDGIRAGPQILEAYCPVSLVTVDRTFSISAGLDASTVTPGRTAPDVSRTTPVIDACAGASAGIRMVIRARAILLAKTRAFIRSLLAILR